MSFASAAATEDADAEDGSSHGSPSFPSTSDGSTRLPSSHHSSRYPVTLSAQAPKRKPTDPSKLETFEDLLREAGYEHTRVVTPSAEGKGKDDATYSPRKPSDEHVSNSGDLRGYVTSVTSFIAWLGGRSTTVTSQTTSQPSNTPAPYTYHGSKAMSEQNMPELERGSSPTSRRKRNSAQRLQSPLTNFPSPIVASSSQLIPSSSSNITLTPSDIFNQSALRSKRRSLGAYSNSRTPELAVQPALSTSPVQERQSSATSSTTPTNGEVSNNLRRDESRKASKGRRSPLPNTWLKGAPGSNAAYIERREHRTSSVRERTSQSNLARAESISSHRQSHRSFIPPNPGYVRKPTLSLPSSKQRPDVKRWPSEKLLARGTLSRSNSKTGLATPVTVLCRSSSVGNASKGKKKKPIPSLAPSGDVDWPTDNHSKAPVPPKINVHAVNNYTHNSGGKLGRTNSASSSKAFSSYSRGSASGYGTTNLSRVGSAYTTISKTGTGTSGMGSSARLGYEESMHGHSPTTGGFRHRTIPQQQSALHDADDDSENEPRLANILAPHIGSPRTQNGGVKSPPGRQASIQSLRVCLQRHHSISSAVGLSRTTHSGTFPHHDNGPLSPRDIPTLQVNPSYEDPIPVTSASNKRRSGQFGSRRDKGRNLREFDDDPSEYHRAHCRRIEGAVGQGERIEDVERGRQGTRGFLGSLRWSPSHSSAPVPASTNIKSRNNSVPVSKGFERGRKKMAEREMERERLLWGTNWARREADREGTANA